VGERGARGVRGHIIASFGRVAGGQGQKDRAGNPAPFSFACVSRRVLSVRKHACYPKHKALLSIPP